MFGAAYGIVLSRWKQIFCFTTGCKCHYWTDYWSILNSNFYMSCCCIWEIIKKWWITKLVKAMLLLKFLQLLRTSQIGAMKIIIFYPTFFRFLGWLYYLFYAFHFFSVDSSLNLCCCPISFTHFPHNFKKGILAYYPDRRALNTLPHMENLLMERQSWLEVWAFLAIVQSAVKMTWGQRHNRNCQRYQ